MVKGKIISVITYADRRSIDFEEVNQVSRNFKTNGWLTEKEVVNLITQLN